MSNPLPLGGKRLALQALRRNRVIHGAVLLLTFGVSARVCFNQPAVYARAYAPAEVVVNSNSPLLEENKSDLFAQADKKLDIVNQNKKIAAEEASDDNNDLSKKIYNIVGDAPIKEMVPFISKQDVKVAAFLVGIAEKESGLGQASPSKDGKDCYNYWGYKGEGARGDVLGYSCFASAQEAVETVGTRINTLVNQDDNTPARMVVWKCGSACREDNPSDVQSWITGVSQYFNRIVS